MSKFIVHNQPSAEFCQATRSIALCELTGRQFDMVDIPDAPHTLGLSTRTLHLRKTMIQLTEFTHICTQPLDNDPLRFKIYSLSNLVNMDKDNIIQSEEAMSPSVTSFVENKELERR